MKTLLIPTDFSAASQQAIQYGISSLQEKREEGKILLLNTYLLPTASPAQLVAIHDELRKKSTQQLKEQVGLAQQKVSDHQITFEVLSHLGTLENVVTHLAQEQKVDAVIFGVEENPKEKDRVSKLLNRISCPLILVSDEKANTDKNHIAS